MPRTSGPGDLPAPSSLTDTTFRGRIVRRVSLLQNRYAGQMWQRVMRRDLAAHALALSAQQVLCTAPLLVAGSAVMQRLGYGTAVDLLGGILGLDEPSRVALGELFRPDGNPPWRTLVLGALASLVFGLSVASTTQRMLETMWDVDRAPFTTMWRQLVWLAALLPGLAVAIYITHLLRAPTFADPVTLVVVGLAMGVCAFVFSWWSQWLLLMGRVGWRRLLPGSVVIGLAIALVSVGAGVVVPHQIVEQNENYGPIGVALVLASWIVALTGAVCTGVLAGAVLDERKLEADERRAASRGRRQRLVRRSRAVGLGAGAPEPTEASPTRPTTTPRTPRVAGRSRRPEGSD